MIENTHDMNSRPKCHVWPFACPSSRHRAHVNSNLRWRATTMAKKESKPAAKDSKKTLKGSSKLSSTKLMYQIKPPTHP